MEENKSILKEIKRHMNVLREDIGGQVKLIAEQHNSVIERLDSHTEMIASIKEDTEIMKIDIKVNKGNIEILKEDVKINKENIGILKEDVKINKENIGTIKQDVKINKENIEILKEDVVVIKEDVKTNKENIGDIKDSLKQKTNIEDFEALNKKMFLLEAKAQ